MPELCATLAAPAVQVAQRLIGCELVRQLDDQIIHLRIVETEAYDQTDAASHSYRGRTARTDIMFGPAGYLYVYFTYGMHYCCNVVTGPDGEGAAVLIRAVEPLSPNLQPLAIRRLGQTGYQLTSGPAKLCQALAITKELNGHNLQQPPLQLVMRPAVASSQIVQTTRIGISQAKDKPWRFYLTGSPYISRLQ